MGDVVREYGEALEKGHQAAIAGHPRQALAHYEAAARLADTRPLPHVCIGGVLLRIGRTQDAIAAYDRALLRAPEDPSALSGKAAAFVAAGRNEDAEDLAVRLRQAERLGAQQRLDAADIAIIREAERSGSQSRPEVLHIAAELAWLAGRHETALDLWLESARGFAEIQQLDAALDSCQQALLASPGAPRVHLELSRLYLRQGWADKAAERLALLGRLLELEPDPELSTALHSLARLHSAEDPRLAALASD
ncbi:hypothetical protein BH23CHL6_BH23CHL6_02880 [soil metagenome]